MELTSLDPDATVQEILQHIERDGGVIVRSYLSADRVDGILVELDYYIRNTVPFPDDFSGHQTARTGGLVARSRGVRELLVDPRMLGVATSFLEPYTDKIQLNLTQIIRLMPGQPAQALHRDRFIWGRQLPRDIEPQLNTIWAMTDFTAENGATRVVPGSHRWDWDREPQPSEVVQAVMPKGSVLFYTGSVIHGGGANRSAAERIGMNLTYSNAWLRQEENQYLSCPPEVAAHFDPELRALLGYTMANYALGYYAPIDFIPGTPGTCPPELAFADGAEQADIPEARTF
ncbi:MAG TPA: phytanoyl-CoA dioxygenase family protein [Pseudomonadales bacterium]